MTISIDACAAVTSVRHSQTWPALQWHGTARCQCSDCCGTCLSQVSVLPLLWHLPEPGACADPQIILGMDYTHEQQREQLQAVRDSIIRHVHEVPDPLIVIEGEKPTSLWPSCCRAYQPVVCESRVRHPRAVEWQGRA